MLEDLRHEWHTKEEMMREHMNQQWHWQQDAESYDNQLQNYYQQRAAHQMQCVRLNQILYGIHHHHHHPTSSTITTSGPPPAQPMAISPIPAPRNPLQVQEHNSMMQVASSQDMSFGFNHKKNKRSASGHNDNEESSAWDIHSNMRMSKRHHH